MKLSTFIMILATVQALSATTTNAEAQTASVSLNLNNVQVKEAIKSIEKQSGYRFFYTEGLNDMNNRVSVNVNEESIESVLSEVLSSTKLGFKVNDNGTVVIAPKEALQNQRKVAGVVTDKSGEPLIGVNVLVKGTSNGIATDINGHYSLNISGPNDVLVFSYIGFTSKEVAVNGKTALDVVLSENAQALEEVVVMGYSPQSRRRMTSAVTTVSAEQIANKPVPNAVAALQGAAPGLVVTRTNGQPGSEGYSAQIRGITSVNGTSPLVIIDGAPGTMSNMNPDDIETITILKDGAAAAIYGARAAGGVILIATKKGKYNSKIKFEYNGLLSMDRGYGMPGRLNSWEELDMENIARINGANNPTAAIWSQQEMEWAKDPNVNYIANGADYLYYYNTDYTKALIKDSSPSQTHSVSVSGGGENSTFRLSAGYYDKEGVLKYGPDSYSRVNMLMNYSTRMAKRITFDSQIAYTNLFQERALFSAADIFQQAYASRRIFPLTAPNTDYAPNGGKGSGVPTYALLKNGGTNETHTDQMNGSFNLTIDDILDYFKVRVVYAPKFSFNNVEQHVNKLERYGVNGPVATINAQSSITKQRQKTLDQTFNFLLDYEAVIKENHTISAFGGVAVETHDYDAMSATANELFTTQPWSLNFGEPTKNAISDNIQNWRLLSYIGKVNYSYNDRYLLEASFRYDGSSRLAPDKRWSFFPSVSAGWNITRESWFNQSLKEKTTLSDLKFRASWGLLGNNARAEDNNTNNYEYIPAIVRGGNYPFNNVVNYSYFENSLPTIITWEKVSTVNAGVDFGLLKNRLTGSFDYYVKNTYDMFASPSYPETIGVNTGVENIGKMKSWGWEASLKWADEITLSSKPLGYSIGVSVWDNNNKITEYLAQKTVGMGTNRIIEGMPMNSIYGYQSPGYFQSWDDIYPDKSNPTKMVPVPASRPYTSPGDLRYLDLNGDGFINSGEGTVDSYGDLTYLGNTSPRYSFGFNLSLDWNGFDLSLLIQGVGKRNMMVSPDFVVPFSQSWFQPFDFHADYWREDNRDARFPRPFLGVYNREVSTKWIQSAAYARLKNLQIGYTIPKSLTKKISVDRARFFFSGENLGEISGMDFKLYDPESPDRVAFQYPLYRSYAVGLNITF